MEIYLFQVSEKGQIFSVKLGETIHNSVEQEERKGERRKKSEKEQKKR